MNATLVMILAIISLPAIPDWFSLTTVLTIDIYYNIIVNVFKQDMIQALGSPPNNLTLHYFILYN